MKIYEFWCNLYSKCFNQLGFAYLPYTGDYNGLGNRIKGIANVYRLGYRKVLLIWNKEGWVTRSAKDLLSVDGVMIKEINNSNIGYGFCKKVLRRYSPECFTQKHPFWSFLLPDDFRDKKFLHKWSFCNETIYSIDFRFMDIPESVRELYRPFFSALKPSRAVMNRVSMVNLSSDIVAVQIRNSDDKGDAKNVCSLETIINRLNKFSADQKFFISAMCESVAQRIRSAFPGRIIELPSKDYASMIDATADMWILGHCKSLICSPSSTFSEIAWWWGGAVCPVEMLPSEYNQKS